MRSLTGESGAKPEISRPYPRRFLSTVSQEQYCPPVSSACCVFVLCVHVDQNAPLQCRGGKNPCKGSYRVVTYFPSFSSGAHISCNRVPPRSRSIFADRFVCRVAAPATSLNTPATPAACIFCQSGISLLSLGRHFLKHYRKSGRASAQSAVSQLLCEG